MRWHCSWTITRTWAARRGPAQIAEDTGHARADRFGVRQVELCHDPGGRVYCLLDGPDEDAIRQHHAALGVPCGEVYTRSTASPGQDEPNSRGQGARMSIHEYLLKARQDDAVRAGERDRQLLEARRARMARRQRPDPAAPVAAIAPVRRLARLLFHRATA